MRIKIEMELPRWLSRLILVGIPIAIVAIGAWVYAGVKTFNPGDKLTATDLNDSFTALQNAISANAVPAGTVVAFAGSVVPAGWLLCDGSLVSRTQYPALFAAIQVSFGLGDAVSTFGLPDYRGRFLRGLDASGTNVPAEKDRTVGQYEGAMTALPQAGWSVSTNGDHTHAGGGYLYASGTASDFHVASSASYYFSAVSIPSAGAHSHAISGGDAETRPPNAAVRYLIKY